MTKNIYRYNPDEYALQGGIWKPEDLERARIENQRESAKNAAIDAVGTVIGQGEYGGQRLPPQSKTVDQIWGSFGSVSDYLGFLGLQFGWNWKSFIIVFSVISIAAMIINYQYMVSNTKNNYHYKIVYSIFCFAADCLQYPNSLEAEQYHGDSMHDDSEYPNPLPLLWNGLAPKKKKQL